MARDIIDRFHKGIYNVIAEKLEERRQGLENGTARDYAEYRHMTGYIRGLTDVLEWCQEVEKDQYGPQERKE
jgi:hypothetical protein